MTYIKTIAAPPGQECQHIPMTPEEVATRRVEEATAAAAQPRLDLLTQIAKLEAQQTPRRLREAQLDIENPKGWLASLEAQIAALRAKL